ncbi:MAG: hypothetical protein WAT66_14680 [Actinomycetota bacterium]
MDPDTQAALRSVGCIVQDELAVDAASTGRRGPTPMIHIPLAVAQCVLGLCYLVDDLTPSERASRLALRIKVAEAEKR